jgi:glyoxylase-like metal-dependent hydrolase (beta-lactamase superfamily II)
MKIHQINGYIQSIYLIEYQDRLLLLDSCCRADISILTQYIKNTLARPITDLHTIIVTHMHPDHAGAAHKLRKITGCKIASANVDGHWYQGFDGIMMHLTDILLAHWVANRMKKTRMRLWYQRKLRPDIKLNDGDLIPGFSDWQAIFTQGHTDRDLSLLHSPSNKLYVADLMVKVKGRYIPPFPVFYPNRYLASLKKVHNMNLDAIWLAHGGEITLTEDDYNHLYEQAPSVPLTHWRSVKIKFFKAMGFYS